MKKLKKITAIFITITIMILYAGCTDIEGNNSSDKIGFVMEGIDVPEVVLDAAKSQVEQLFEINETDYSDYNYNNWRIENLTYSYTYDDLNGMQLVIFQQVANTQDELERIKTSTQYLAIGYLLSDAAHNIRERTFPTLLLF